MSTGNLVRSSHYLICDDCNGDNWVFPFTRERHALAELERRPNGLIVEGWQLRAIKTGERIYVPGDSITIPLHQSIVVPNPLRLRIRLR